MYFENFQSELGSVVVKEEEGQGRVRVVGVFFGDRC